LGDVNLNICDKATFCLKIIRLNIYKQQQFYLFPAKQWMVQVFELDYLQCISIKSQARTDLLEKSFQQR